MILKRGIVILCISFSMVFANKIHEAKILEVINAGLYSYLHLEGKSKKYWAVVNKVDLPVNTWVRFKEEIWYENYHSKILNRDFSDIVFGSNLYYKTN
jgi:hypothetical protein